MGTRVAPTYACLFMCWLQEQLLLKTWKGTPPLMYRRFIDDVFFAWTSTEEELKLFLTHMNQQHPYIKFTTTYDMETKNVPFLDMSVTIKNGKIITDLYKKETAVVQYLLPSSCHASHQWQNTIFSLAYRLRRICSTDESFEIRLEELKSDLMS